MTTHVTFKTNPDKTIDLIVKNLSKEEIEDLLSYIEIDKAGEYIWPADLDLVISTVPLGD